MNVNWLRISSILAIVVMLCSCKERKHDQSEIESAMKYYDHLVLKLDADSISRLYTEDGNLGDVAIGRDAIKDFLSSFNDVKVLSQVSTTTSIVITADTAIQKGEYVQSDLIGGKETVQVTGEYTTRWQWTKDEGWRIKKMYTKTTN